MTLKRWGLILVVLLFVVAVVLPVMADYLGPNRTVTTYVWERLHCHYQAIYDPPGAGWYGCYLDLYQTPDSSCPSTSSVAGYFTPTDCSWPSGFCQNPGCDITLSGSKEECNEGQTGCRATETTVTHPPATVSGSLVCAVPGNNGWCRGGGEISLTGTEPLSGYSILTLEGTRNGETFACPGESCSVPLVEGTSNFTFWALSSWGDSSLKGTASSKLDSSPPVISGELTGKVGEGGWYVSEVKVVASASDTISGVASFEMALDGGGWAAYSGPVALMDGNHSVDIRVVDTAGNISTQSQAVWVDTQPPSLTLDADASFCPGCSETLGISVDIQDLGSDVTTWTLSADGVTIKESSGPSSETLNWNGSGLAAGGHTLILQARDEAGNASEASQGVTLVAPTQPPPPPPTKAPSRPKEDAPAATAVPTVTPIRTSTAVNEASPTPTRIIVHPPTRTPSTFIFGGPPAAPPDEGSMESLSGPDSTSGESLTEPESGFGESLTAPEPSIEGGSSNVLWGAGAAALIAAATAVAVEATRRRKEAEAREREEMARRNAQAEAREEAERQRLAALAAVRQEITQRLEEFEAAHQDAEQQRQEELALLEEAKQQHMSALYAARQALLSTAATTAAIAAAEAKRREALQRRIERNLGLLEPAPQMNQPQGISNPQAGAGAQGSKSAFVSEETISEAADNAGSLAKLYRKARGVSNASEIAFNELADGYISVSAPGIPAGQKLQFRLDQYIAGTRYSSPGLAFATGQSLIWRTVNGLGANLGISAAVNAIDYGIGEHSDKGIGSKEFFASTLVDFGVAGLTGLAAAGIVGVVITAASITAPFAAAVAATALLGIGLGLVVNHVFDMDRLKGKVTDGFIAWGGNFENIKTIVRVGTERVADGFSAWGGIFENTKTIISVGADRATEAMRNAVDHVVDAGKQAVETVSGTVGDMADKVSYSVNKVTETTTNALKQAGQSVSDTIGKAANAASEFLGGLFGGSK
jgi:hypothetical protein